MELIFGFVMQFLWPILIALGALLGFVFYGAKKKSEGKAAERERAQAARDKAAQDAARTRDAAAAKPIDQQRKSVQEWEQ